MRNIARAVLLISIGFATPALAADFPEKAVRFIVPFPPGGGTDALARLLAVKLTETWNQQIIIDNRGGAQGSLGTALGAKAAPDGYTITLGHSGALVINPHMYNNPGYDTLRDFAPVTRGTEMPYVLVVHPSVPAKNMNELAQLAKAHPGRLTFASTSAGPQLMGELFRLMTKTNMVHVPYKGAGPAVIDLLGGHVGIMFTVPTSVNPHIRGAVAFGANGLIGVAGVIKQQGLGKQVAVVGTTMPSQAKPLIMAGIIREAFLWSPFDAGYAMVALGRLVHDGQPVTDGMELRGVGRVDVDTANRLVKADRIMRINRDTVDRLIASGL